MTESELMLPVREASMVRTIPSETLGSIAVVYGGASEEQNVLLLRVFVGM